MELARGALAAGGRVPGDSCVPPPAAPGTQVRLGVLASWQGQVIAPAQSSYSAPHAMPKRRVFLVSGLKPPIRPMPPIAGAGLGTLGEVDPDTATGIGRPRPLGSLNSCLMGLDWQAGDCNHDNPPVEAHQRKVRKTKITPRPTPRPLTESRSRPPSRTSHIA